MLVLIPAAPLLIQLLDCGMGKQWRMAHTHGTLHLCVRSGRSSGLLALNLLTSGHYGHLGHETADGRSSSLSPLLHIYISCFPIKVKKKKKRLYKKREKMQ